MLKSLMAALFLGIILLAVPAGASAEDPGNILRNLERALAAGEELRACRLAVQLKAYPESPAYAKAGNILLARGISITAPLKSYTIKRILDLQNATERIRARTGNLPDAGLRDAYEDAWGTPLRVEMISNKAFAYLVRSAGPDRRFLTGDDLAIGQRHDAAAGPPAAGAQDQGLEGLPGADKASKAPAKVDTARGVGYKSMLQRQQMGSGSDSGGGTTGGGATSGGSPPSHNPSEKKVSLDDLLKQ